MMDIPCSADRFPVVPGRLSSLGLALVLLLAGPTLAAEQKINGVQGGLTGPLTVSDQFGSAIAPLGDFDGDGVPDLVVGAPGDGDGGPGRGALFLLLMNPDGTVKSDHKISQTAGGFPGTLADLDRFGSSVTTIGDLDGDGVTDLAVGAPRSGSGALEDRGSVWILWLNADATVKAAEEFWFTGFTLPLGGDRFGHSLAHLGDLFGNGGTTLAIGVPFSNLGGTDRGAVHLVNLAPSPGTTLEFQYGWAIAPGYSGCPNLADHDHFGYALASLGDVDGNGGQDLAVGAPDDDTLGGNTGVVYRLTLSEVTGAVTSIGEIVPNMLPGGIPTTHNNQWGASLASGADLNGDGSRDLLIGEPGKDGDFVNQGGLWLIFANMDQQIIRHEQVGEAGETLGLDWEPNGLAGQSLVMIGDLDGDGQTDWAIGAPNDDETAFAAGAVWVVMPDPGHYDWTTSFFDVGGGVDGTTAPVAFSSGTMSAGTWHWLELHFSLPGTSATLVLGASGLHAPFKGGVLVPSPDVLLTGFVTDATGRAHLDFQWPTNLPSGTTFFAQWWVQDAGAPKGLQASNGLECISK